MTAKLFVISGPSGAGKTSILQKLFQRRFVRANFLRGISYTTRQKRTGEKGGRDYYFVSKPGFLKLKKEKFFLETQKVLENFYGTAYHTYQKALRQKKGLIICIDVKGGKYLKKSFKKDRMVSVFIGPPRAKELYRRLTKRGETKETIGKRVRLAEKEMKYIQFYDYVVINDKIKESVDNLEAILRAEQLRRGK
jgi:guanylate kinase